MVVLVEQIAINRENKHKRLRGIVERQQGLETEGEDPNPHLTVLFTIWESYPLSMGFNVLPFKKIGHYNCWWSDMETMG